MSAAREDKISGDIGQPTTEARKLGKNSDGIAKKSSSSVSGKKRKPSSSVSEGKPCSPPFPPPDSSVKTSSYVLPSGRTIIIFGADPDAGWEEMKKKMAQDVDWKKMEEEEEEEEQTLCVGAVKRKDCPDWEDYKKQLHDNRGYELTIYPGPCLGATFEPWVFRVDNDLTTFAEFISMCRGAITYFNRRTLPEERYRFISEDVGAIEHVTRNFETDYDKFYITFKACQVRNPSIVHSFRAEYLFGPYPGCKRKKKTLMSCKQKDDPIWEEDKKYCTGFPCCPGRLKRYEHF